MKFLFHLIKLRYSSIQGILFFFVFATLYSCVSLKKIGIEVSVLPEYPIAEDIQSLVILNRSMTSRFTNNNVDSLEKILVNNKMSLDTILQDSIAADTVIKVAANALFESGRFDVVVPKEQNIVRNDTDENVSPLNINFINEVCKDFNVDAVLVLESFTELLNTKYYLYDNGYKNQRTFDEIKEYRATTDINYLSDWRLYRANGSKPVIRFQVGDSIFWNESSYALEELYSQMPRTKEALIGGGIAAGLKIAGYISPGWVNQSRYYYLTGKAEIDVAVPLIKNNKWEEAAAIWSKYSTISSKSIRSKIEFNLALAAEMNGDLDQAIEWGFKSFKTKYSKAIEVYLKTLDNKVKAQKKEDKKRY